MLTCTMKKEVFCNWPCNSPCLSTVNVIGQVARVARVTIRSIYGAIHYNSITTLSQQLLFNYATPL
jgi:hypothetical protein